jgi:uncharacterized membrane protein YfcA
MFDVIDPAYLALLPAYVFLGCFVGFCAGLLGIGGGVILVPGLYFILTHIGGQDLQSEEVVMHTALATSMAVILPTGLSSSWAQIKRKGVDWDAVKLMTPGLMIGVCFGVFVVTNLSSTALKVIFSIGLYGVAASILMRKEDAQAHPILMKRVVAFPITVVIGIAATLLGMGGAILNIPYLSKAGFPLKRAIASASVLGVLISLPATIGYLVSGSEHALKGGVGYINLAALAMIVPVSVLMAPVGVKASHALSVQKLKIVFAVLLLLVATKMLFEII